MKLLARPLVLALLAALPLTACAQAPIRYAFSVPDPATHLAHIEATFPTDAQPDLDLMMPVWTPGFYRVEDYAGKVQNLSAKTPEGQALAVTQAKNHWHIATGGAASVVVTYDLLCTGRSVTTNWVGTDLAVINGGAAFITEAQKVQRPVEVDLTLPPAWKKSISSLDIAPDGNPNHYISPDFDTLVDSPIVAGDLSIHEFDVGGAKHYLADVGTLGKWDGQAAADQLEKIVQANLKMWGALPYKKYVFLNIFRPGGGGLEHLNSTLLTNNVRPAATNPATTAPATPPISIGWLDFVSHEYFHAYNVKRIRPIELGPFDYEHPPSTPSLWISEGVTVYYESLMVSRGGIGTTADLLTHISSSIAKVQNAPGRLKQTLNDASLNVWGGAGASGVGVDANNAVSYYDKGHIAGFLLDARIQHASGGKKTMDDLMREALKRYGGKTGFTPDQFRALAEEVAGVDLKEFFQKTLATTQELDYSEALEWYGLRFAANADPAKAWQLEVRPDATAEQKARLHTLSGNPK